MRWKVFNSGRKNLVGEAEQALVVLPEHRPRHVAGFIAMSVWFVGGQDLVSEGAIPSCLWSAELEADVDVTE